MKSYILYPGNQDEFDEKTEEVLELPTKEEQQEDGTTKVIESIKVIVPKNWKELIQNNKYFEVKLVTRQFNIDGVAVKFIKLTDENSKEFFNRMNTLGYSRA